MYLKKMRKTYIEGIKWYTNLGIKVFFQVNLKIGNFLKKYKPTVKILKYGINNTMLYGHY